jgi:hypothetical protein
VASEQLGTFLERAMHQGRMAALIVCAWFCLGLEAVQVQAATIQTAPVQAAREAAPARCVSVPRPGDEIWIVSSRGLGCQAPEKAALRMQYWRYEAGRWAVSSRDEFLSGPEDLVTSFFVVGNDFSHSDTVKAGWTAYRGLVREDPDSPHLRFVIWSWPSDRLPGRRLNDAKVKLARTPAASYYMAWLVDQLPDEMPISMSGYSFGARIIMGSLELLAGGRTGCYQLAARQSRQPRRIDAVLIGAAIDNDDFLPGQRFGRSLSQVHQLLVFFNPADRALRFYRFLYGHHVHIEAAGLTGPVGLRRLGAERKKVFAFDVNGDVGRSHGADDYFQSARLLRVMHPFLFDPPDLDGDG